MLALKIMLEGDVTSFRYPHFVQGVHPTYDMPPPATIYGLVCSAVGHLIDPAVLRFAYHFRYDSKFVDYEHLHFFGKKPKMNPFKRELLYNPRLSLYLAAQADVLEQIAESFRRPRYTLSLGRSQDLIVLSSVAQIEIVQAEQAFYSGTLLTLPHSAEIGGRSFAVNMPRYINEERIVDWAQYAILPDDNRPVIYPDRNGTRFDMNFPIWVDTSEPHPYEVDIYRGVVWHDWA